MERVELVVIARFDQTQVFSAIAERANLSQVSTFADALVAIENESMDRALEVSRKGAQRTKNLLGEALEVLEEHLAKKTG